MRYIVTLLAALWALNTQALDIYEWTLDINTSSKHSSPGYGNNQFYNEDNNGAGITYGYSPSIDIKFGYFDNSYGKTSVYAGLVFNKDYYFFNDIIISPGLGFMMATGYNNTPIDAPSLAPIIHPSISIGHKTLRSTIGYIPYGEDTVLTFQTQLFFK